MASRTSRRKSRVVSVDFTDVDEGGGSFHIKEGNYRMKVVEVTQDESDAGNDMFVWTFEGLEKAAKGKKFKVYTTLNDEALWKLRSLLVALGVEVPKGPLDIDLDEMVDLEIIGIVTDDTYQNKLVSRMNDFEPVDGADEEEEKPTRRSSKKEEDDDETDTKTTRRRRTSSKDEEEDEPPKRSSRSKKKELDKVSADEVKAMDDDELESLNEEYDLGVELKDFKTARRRSSAIISALEEKDLLED